jgi:peptidoglycan/xylan/chitin deacetylase (PgdA/CDA1 family)
MMKARLRDAIGCFAAKSGAIARQESKIRGHLTILCYHRILPEPARSSYHDPDLVVTPEIFRQQCRSLAQHYHVLPLSDALASLNGHTIPKRPLAAITFDDGYRDNIVIAAPILRENSLRATFFIVAGLVDTDRVPWYDLAGQAWLTLYPQTGRATVKAELERAKRLMPAQRQIWLTELVERACPHKISDLDRIMTSDDLRVLISEGHEIGSHTMTHPLLPQCEDRALIHEVEQSRRDLSEITGRSVPGICYPNGDCDARVRQATEGAGYDYATSVRQGTNDASEFDRFGLKRWFINQERLSTRSGAPSDTLFRMEISGLADSIFRWRRG